MESKIVFYEDGILNECPFFNVSNSTIHIKNQKDYTLNILYIKNIPSKINIKIENSNVVLIETFNSYQEDISFEIIIDENSVLNRIALFVEKQKDLNVYRNILNSGYYKSLQFDLADFNITNQEEVTLLKQDAVSEVITGIYACNENTKKYKTNLNHQIGLNNSNCKIFAVCDDKAYVKICTDAYIKNGAKGSSTQQEGRIINLSANASGIVLPDLHIDENDVIASHSCSVGSVNKDHLYYLQTRGFSAIEARNLLIKSYFTPILNNISDAKLKNSLLKALSKRID